MTDSTEALPPTDEQLTIEDILGPEANAYRPLLKLWQEVLKGGDVARAERISPQTAVRLTGRYQDIGFADLPAYMELFYTHIDQMADILAYEISTDDQCLTYDNPEDDLEHNHEHYLNLLYGWQKCILGWELDWDCTDPDAAIALAAIAEVHTMFFGEVGLTSLLDQIRFEFTEEHQDQLRVELEELRDSWAAPAETV